MTFHLGENLRTYRLQKGLTQEQVADVFSVSPQAISRWENGSAYPDVTLLPGIAMYFDVSLDTLLGMDKLRDADALNEIHCRVHTLVSVQRYAEAVTLIKDSLKRYPNNSGLLIELCEVFSQTDNTHEAIAVSERALKLSDISMKARSTVTANLLYLYLRADRKQDAEHLLQTLPHVWESREMLKAELCNDAEYVEALKATIKQLLCFCYSKIEACPARQYGVTPPYIQLGMDVNTDVNTETMLNAIREFVSDT